ncbi:glycosyltransferase family 4 protein [Okibacterium fritillariae]|uniref:Glycosyltransferase involved in cell wall bisynthesis n=1 Tax=Okibacterium fritillariae TaxID=123320 RepID=A0A1T5KAT8_9MICO|nr:Glycosyltransferase involved in cell wall bisynthesis [Okibacterium fritillariae]
MSELHLISPNDELSRRNGSAILTVARELSYAAHARGTQSVVGGGRNQLKDLDFAVEAIQPPSANRAAEIADGVTKLLFGKSLRAAKIDALPDVQYVFAHNLPWLGGEIAKKFPEARRILYVHNRILTGAPPITIRRVLSAFDVVICVSEYIRTDLLRRAGRAPACRIVVVYNGVDYEKFSAAEAGKEFASDVAFVGRIIPEKGASEFAKAVAKVSSVRPLTVTFVGGKSFLPSDHESGYEREVRQILENSEAEVNRTGPIPPARIPAIMNAAKVVAVPSVWPEPCALVFLEAMASDAAVLASRVGGLPEVGLDAGVTFVEPGDSDGLSRALIELLDNQERREVQSQKSRQWAEERPWAVVYADVRRVVS